MNRPPQTAPKRDPKRTAAGKAVLARIVASSPPNFTPILKDLSDATISDAIYYLDGLLFLPSGTGKAARLLRAEAKKRGVL
jgi:hypothetical protein